MPLFHIENDNEYKLYYTNAELLFKKTAGRQKPQRKVILIESLDGSRKYSIQYLVPANEVSFFKDIVPLLPFRDQLVVYTGVAFQPIKRIFFWLIKYVAGMIFSYFVWICIGGMVFMPYFQPVCAMITDHPVSKALLERWHGVLNQPVPLATQPGINVAIPTHTPTTSIIKDTAIRTIVSVAIGAGLRYLIFICGGTTSDPTPTTTQNILIHGVKIFLTPVPQTTAVFEEIN